MTARKQNRTPTTGRPSETAWYPASLMIPVSIQDNHFTNVYFYPIYSPSKFHIDVEIYNALGQMIGKKENVLTIKSPSPGYHRIPIKSICQELGIYPGLHQNSNLDSAKAPGLNDRKSPHISNIRRLAIAQPRELSRGPNSNFDAGQGIKGEKELGARIIAIAENNQRIPARIKLGLDVGEAADQMPCNICTNLQPFNPALETKPKSFRWGPVLADQKNALVWLMNSAPLVHYEKSAEIEVTFFFAKKTHPQSLEKSLFPSWIRPHSRQRRSRIEKLF